MKKIILITISILLLASVYATKHSGRFPIGSYSYMANIFPWHKEYRDELCRQLQQLGYNSTMIHTDTKDDDLKGMFEDLDKYGLDAILLDRSWSPDTSSGMHYGLQPLATSNYNKFEAEYSGEASVRDNDTFDNTVWYSSVSDKKITRIGTAKPDDQASNGYVWYLAKGQTPGYAYTDLSQRWPKADGTYFRVGQIWQVFQSDPSTNKEQFFYINYRFKLDNLKQDLADADTLLTFEPSGFPLQGGGYAAKPVSLAHQKDTGKIKNTLSAYTLADYKGARTIDGYIIVTIKMSYADMIASGMMSVVSPKMLKIINLNPRVFWHGNCDLYLDYIEYEDQMHYDLRTNPILYSEGIKYRAEYLKGLSKGNLLSLYAFDEPLQSQLDSFRLIQNYLDGSGIDVFTAVHDYNYRVLQIDKESDTYYSHLDNFFRTAQPKIVVPDIYPIVPDLDWNGNKQGVFIQTHLNQKLHTAYTSAKEYRDKSPERSFIPVVQVFGKWAKADKGDQWSSWMLAPYATQKALNYFPLCYGPDGILHYRLQSFRTPDGLGEYCTVISINENGKYSAPANDSIPYRAVVDTNPKVEYYGNTIQSLKWLDAVSLMPENASLSGYYMEYGLNHASVQRSKGEYQGYVQCGFYESTSGSPVLMLVNRRGNYYLQGKYDLAKNVPYNDYEQCFPEAEPQTVSVEFTRKAGKTANKELVWYDPFDNAVYPHKKGKASIKLPAGEARMLSLVQIPPKTIKKNTRYENPVLIMQDTQLTRKASLTCTANTELLVLPNATLTITEGTTAVIEGTLRVRSGGKVVIKGTLRITAENVIIEEGGQIFNSLGEPYEFVPIGTKTKQI